MSFVFPVILGGVILAGIPILLHLIMRQKPKSLSFPAFRFLLQKHRRNQRKLRLRHLLLLALRILLIVGLCLALAQPKLFDVGFNWRDDRPVAAVFVFDTSPTMAYQTSDGKTRLADAQKRGLELLEELPEGSRVAILDTADTGYSGKSDWHFTRGPASQRILGLRINPAGGSATRRPESAYRLLAELAGSKDDAVGARLPRLHVIFTDRTRGAWEAGRLPVVYELSDQVPPLFEGAQAGRGDIPALQDMLKELRANLPPPAGQDYPEQALLDDLDKLRDQLSGLRLDDYQNNAEVKSLITRVRGRSRELLQRLPAEQDVPAAARDFRTKLGAGLQRLRGHLSGQLGLLVDVGLDKPADLAIVDLELPRLASGQMRQVFGADEKIPLRAIVQATGRDFDQTVLFQFGKDTFKQAVSLKAGARKVIPWEIDAARFKLTPGPHQVAVRLEQKDQLLFNNKRFATFAIREPRPVLILADGNPARGQYLGREFHKAENSFGFKAEVMPAPTKSLNTYKAIFLLSMKEPPAALWKQLKEYVAQGGGLAIVPGDMDMAVKAYNEGTAQDLMPGHFKKVVAQGDAKLQEKGAKWDLDPPHIYQHSLLKPFREWRLNAYDVVTKPQTFLYWHVEPHKAANSLVAYAGTGHPAWLERPVGKGKVLLFTTLLDYTRTPFWNNYPAGSFYMILVFPLTTGYLAGHPDEVKLNFICGQDEPVVTLPSPGQYLSYRLRGPDTLEQIAVSDKQAELRLKQAAAPGNYTVEGVAGRTGSTRVASFSMNLPPEESDLARIPAGDIEPLLGQDAVVPIDRRANIRDVLEGHWSQPVELFPFLMVLLLVILALENLLANKFYKKAPEEAEKV